MMRYLNEMMWFPAAFLAGNISFEAVDDSSALVTLTGQGRTATATWSTPVTGYGEFEGLRLPASGKALYKLPGGDLDYIDVTITGLHCDTAPAPEQEAR